MRRFLVVMAVVWMAACGNDQSGPRGTSLPALGPSSSGSSLSAPAVHQTSAVLRASAGIQRSPADPSAPVSTLVAGFNEAGFKLWNTQPATDNVVFSPASIGHALLMARAAADDATGAAIDQTFALPAGISAHEAWNAVDQEIRAGQSDDLKVTIADRIWPAISLEPNQAWIDLLAADHGADVEALDYSGDPDGSRKVINAWVSDQTERLIPELMPAGSIDPNTALVLTDAVYFAAHWQTPFGKYGTVNRIFTTLDGSEVPVDFMRELELSDRRGVGDGFVGAEIPYVGGDFSMLVIVPDQGRFEEVRGRLDQEMLDEIDSSFSTGPYELLLPKWDDHYQLDLLPWLTTIGAAPGSYPKISSDAVLGAALHAADITVDEQGTVAAAATGLAFPASGPPEPELTVAADKPFLYLIRHRSSGLVLFAGQVTNPT